MQKASSAKRSRSDPSAQIRLKSTRRASIASFWAVWKARISSILSGFIGAGWSSGDKTVSERWVRTVGENVHPPVYNVFLLVFEVGEI